MVCVDIHIPSECALRIGPFIGSGRLRDERTQETIFGCCEQRKALSQHCFGDLYRIGTRKRPASGSRPKILARR